VGGVGGREGSGEGRGERFYIDECSTVLARSQLMIPVSKEV